MLDRSHTANLFLENAEQADEFAGAADVALEQPAASPQLDGAEAQFDVWPSTTAPSRARRRRPRPVGGGRRGTVRAKLRVAAPKGQLSLPALLRLRGWARRARRVAPVLLLLVVVLAENPAGCAQSTRSRSPVPITPAGAAPTRIHPSTDSNHPTRPARASHSRQRHPVKTDTATSGVVAHRPARISNGDGAPAVAASTRQVTVASPAVTHTVVPSASVPVAPNVGSPPREGRSEGHEFGFER
jgi:hypothetical protein